MLVNLGIALGASIVTLFGTALFARVIIGRGKYTVAIMQILGMGTLAYLLFTAGIVGFIGAGIIAAFPLVTRLIAVGFIAWMGRRALTGKLGEETQWAAELVEEGDKEFMQAAKALPSYELKEVGIIAESKTELRDLTIERYEELAQ